jgi:hypothetical protein
MRLLIWTMLAIFGSEPCITQTRLWLNHMTLVDIVRMPSEHYHVDMPVLLAREILLVINKKLA